MTVVQRFDLKLNIDKNVATEKIIVTANDNVEVHIQLLKGKSIFPLSEDYIYRLVSKPKGKTATIKNLTLVDGKIVAPLNHSETGYKVPIECIVQVFDAEGNRVSSVKFDVAVLDDFSTSAEVVQNGEAVFRLVGTAEYNRIVKGLEENKDESENLNKEIDSINLQLTEKATKQELANIGSASPKGVYQTLVDLEKALPSGGNGVYVVTTDGNWYYWNGDAWTVGGTYQSTRIADESISPIKTSFMEMGKNLFDKSAVSTGYYVRNTDGTMQVNENFSASEFIEIKPNTQYTISFFNQTAFYDENKKYISGVDGYNEGVKTVTSPANAYFLRTTIYNSALNTYQLEEGPVNTSYESYFVKLPNKFLDQNTVTTLNKVDKIRSALIHPKEISKRLILENGLQIKLIGDSITAGVGGTGYNLDGDVIYDSYRVNTNGYCWANLFKNYLESKFDCIVKNYGISGRNSFHISTNLESLIEVDDDIVICMIGTNDRNSAANIPLSLYRANLKKIYDYVKGLGKDIIFMSNIPASVSNETDSSNVKSYHMEDIDNNVMAFSIENGMEYISLYKAFMNYCDIKNISVDTFLADGLHPNDNGYTVMFNLICDELGIGRKRIGATW